MSGISGIIYKNQKAEYEDIKAMNDLIIHRGPDGEGFYLDDSLALGHRRLNISDLSDAAAQLMYYKDLVIVFDGRIYNSAELRDELSSLGYTFKTNCETEVLLAAYDCWGQNSVYRLNGMWSFAIFDKKNQILFCSRDRFGTRPFYYTTLDDKFIFGSEIKQLLLFMPSRIADKSILADFLVCGFTNHTDKTFFKNIYTLMGGYNLIFDLKKHSFKIYQYYFVDNTTPKKISIEDFKKVFFQAVKTDFPLNVKVGSCLSGGLDSSSVVAAISDLINENNNKNFVCIHAKSTENTTDESNYAKLVAESKNIDLKLIKPSLEDFINSIDEVCYIQEEPFLGLSIFMQYFVMKEAKKNNCKVLFDGQGSDGLFGNSYYYVLGLLSLPLYSALKSLIKYIRNTKLQILRLIVCCIYFSSFPLLNLRQRLKYSFLKSEYLPDFEWNKRKARAFSSIIELQLLELYNTCLPALMRYDDKNSMWHSIETRFPFLDKKLLETILGLEDDYKVHDGWIKYILRKALENDLPKEVVWRKSKFGFYAPEKSWLSGIHSIMIEGIESNKILKKIFKYNVNLDKLDNLILWRLFSISKWINIFSITDIS